MHKLHYIYWLQCNLKLFILLLLEVLLYLINLLFYLSRFKPNEGVIIIGATNFPEALDKYVVFFCKEIKGALKLTLDK